MIQAGPRAATGQVSCPCCKLMQILFSVLNMRHYFLYVILPLNWINHQRFGEEVSITNVRNLRLTVVFTCVISKQRLDSTGRKPTPLLDSIHQFEPLTSPEVLLN